MRTCSDVADVTSSQDQRHCQSLGDVVHGQGEGDELAQLHAALTSKRHANAYSFRERMESHDDDDQDHLLRIRSFEIEFAEVLELV